MSIYGNPSGGFGFPKTFILTDENGTELTGVVVGEKTIFTANASDDIRIGKVAATSEGVVTGSKIFPFYTTCTGKKIIPAGSEFKMVLSTQDIYDYTELQCIICPFNSTMEGSVEAEKVVIGDNVYDTNSTSVLSTVSKNLDEKSVCFNMTNTTDVPYIIRFITYKEIE